MPHQQAMALMVGSMFLAAAPDSDLTTFEYPSAEEARQSSDRLYMTHAVESYLWGVPALGLAAMIDGARSIGVKPNQMFIFDQTVRPNQHLLTPNADIIYGFAYYDLRNGPVRINLPAGSYVGSALDAWQRPLEDIGTAGRDNGEGATYLIMPPQGEMVAQPEGAIVLRSETNSGLLFLRSFYQTVADRAKAVHELEQVQVTGPSGLVTPAFLVGNRDYNGLAPQGLAAFRRLAEIVSAEPAQERDSFALGQLASIGIRADKPFNPSQAQGAMLDQAAKHGRQIAANLSYDPAGPGATAIYPGTHWIRGTGMKRFDQRDGILTEVDDRAQLFTFGFSAPRSMVPGVQPVAGKGAAYAITYRDANGAFLDGSKTYELKVPPNVPALSYWSLTAYDGETFDLLSAPSQRPNVASLAKPKPQADGSYLIQIGPKVQGADTIETVPGRGYFLIFRLFAPTQPYLDGKWRLGDVQKVR